MLGETKESPTQISCDDHHQLPRGRSLGKENHVGIQYQEDTFPAASNLNLVQWSFTILDGLFSPKLWFSETLSIFSTYNVLWQYIWQLKYWLCEAGTFFVKSTICSFHLMTSSSLTRRMLPSPYTPSFTDLAFLPPSLPLQLQWSFL